jgi:hypothetical protein
MKDLEKLTTDYLFDKLLPSFINVDGELYHFNMIKGKNGPMITYETNSDIQLENVRHMPLASTYRTGDNLRDVCEKTIKWLIEFDYVKHMPYGFKERYERIFNIQVEHSRDFDK